MKRAKKLNSRNKRCRRMYETDHIDVMVKAMPAGMI